MAFETKVILISLAEIVKTAKDKEAIYNAIAKMANSEGIDIGPYHDEQKDKKQEET